MRNLLLALLLAQLNLQVSLKVGASPFSTRCLFFAAATSPAMEPTSLMIKHGAFSLQFLIELEKNDPNPTKQEHNLQRRPAWHHLSLFLNDHRKNKG